MNSKIIKAKIFKYKATQKTIWLFTRLEDNNNVVGWGEATLQGRENEILQNKKGIFELIVNKNFKSPYDLKILLPFNNIIEASISSSIMQAIWDIHARQNKQSIANMFSSKNYGYVSTYHYVNGDWVLFGETSGYGANVSIVPTSNHTSYSLWGALISTNNDGTVVTIGEMNGSSKGGIWRYDSSSDSWNNEHIFSHNTSDVAMSRDGTRVVTGYEGDDTNGSNYGAIRVYDYNSSNQSWSQLGSTLTGYETYDRVGYRVAISGDGNTFFQCASNESSAGNSFAQVYTYIQAANGGNGDWVQKGTDFVGTTATRYGLGSSLDYDGDTLILGSPNVDLAKVYKYLNGQWQQIGSDIDFNGATGASTAINDAGTIFAVGASGTTNGHAGAYILSTVEAPTLNIQDGNVGIATTSPDQKLHVNGRVQAGGMVLGNLPRLGGDWSGLYHTRIHDDTYGVGYNTNAYCLMTGENGSLFLNCVTTTNGSAGIYFQANASTKMFINSSGNVGIGTTSPAGPLQVKSYFIVDSDAQPHIMNQHAVYIGLLAATTFVLLDKYYPSIVINKEEHI